MQRRWKSDDGDKNQEVPFNLQLFESVTKRVEKARQEEIERAHLHQRTARGRFFATLFGMLDPNHVELVFLSNLPLSHRCGK